MEEKKKYLNAYRAETLTGLLNTLNEENITKDDIVTIFCGVSEYIAIIQK